MAVNAQQEPVPGSYQEIGEEYNLSEHAKHAEGKDAPADAAEDDFPAAHQSKQRIAVVMTALSVGVPPGFVSLLLIIVHSYAFS